MNTQAPESTGLQSIPYRILRDAEQSRKKLRRWGGDFRDYLAWHGCASEALLHMPDDITQASIFCELGLLGVFRAKCAAHGLEVPTGMHIKMGDVEGLPALSQALVAAGRVEFNDAPASNCCCY